MKNTHTFHVVGMHCNACVFVIENELNELPHIESAKTDLKSNTLLVSGEFQNQTPAEIVKELTTLLEPHGYTLKLEKEVSAVNWTDFKTAIPIALAFALLFIVLQKIGLVDFINSDEVTYGTAFFIGIIASVSSCMAVVGGLLLSMSATFAKEGDNIKPQILFHTGRIVSFFILGGLIGAIGASFTLNITATFILSIIVALVMLILGLNLLDIFPGLKRFQPSMPKFISKHTHGLAQINHSLTPLLIGVLTFFLPCGFTQSMQLFTLTTGSFLNGGLTMLAFALGTLPVLSLISFSSLSIKNNKNAGIFYKTAGLIVILFALLNIINALVLIGIIGPVFNI